MSGKDPFLLGLFREEVADHSAVLTDGLLGLERDKQVVDAKAIEPLMRAAHSLKGAARVVDLPLISSVAHRMEDVFVAIGEGKVAITTDLVDQLLGALDAMVSVAHVPDAEIDTWLLSHEQDTQDWEAKLSAWLPTVGSPPPVTNGTASAISGQEELIVPESGIPLASGQKPGETEASVRISAENLSQMLAHSADLLLEARRLDTLARETRLASRRVRTMAASRSVVQDAGTFEASRKAWAELGGVMEAHDEELLQLSSRLNFLSERLHNLVLRGRLRPFSEGVKGFPRMMRDLARDLGKEVDFSILGGQTMIDRDILAQMDAPLNHLLRNALDHGVETPAERRQRGKPPQGRVVLEARHLNGRLLITLSDDGGGIDIDALRRKILDQGLVSQEMSEHLTNQEIYAFLFLPGITTKEALSEISGRGVGLDVVQTMIHGCGGALRVTSEAGVGTRFECQLPVTRSVIRCLRVDVDGHAYALPLSRIDRAERVSADQVEVVDGVRFFNGARGRVQIFSAASVIGLDAFPLDTSEHALVLLEAEGKRYALEVDQLVAQLDLVIRPLDVRLGKVAYFSSISIDREGRPILIMDVDDLIGSFDRSAGKGSIGGAPLVEEQETGVARILVVDDSLTVREVERKLLEGAGYVVETAVDGVDGWNQVLSGGFSLIISDVDMPRMNGIELVTKIKADARYHALPIIIVSYKDREEDRLLGLNAGADFYLTKGSFQDQGLLEAVRTLVGPGAKA
jgi:two-component system, chemotaxis family, sensor histidine kinase and response regulator WspE